MTAAGLEVKLPSGAKVFIRPEHYQNVLQTIEREELKLFTSHVLIAEEYLPRLAAALKSVPSACQIGKPKEDKMVVAGGKDSELSDILSELSRSGFEVKHTFIHVPIRSSMRGAAYRASKSQ